MWNAFLGKVGATLGNDSTWGKDNSMLLLPGFSLHWAGTSRSPGRQWAQGGLHLLPVVEMTMPHISKGSGCRKLPPAQISQLLSPRKAILGSAQWCLVCPSQGINLLSTAVKSSVQSMQCLALTKMTGSKGQKLIPLYLSPETAMGEGIRAALCLVGLCSCTSSHKWKLLLFKGRLCSYLSWQQNIQWFQWQQKTALGKKE